MCLFVDTVLVNEGGGELLYLCEIPFDVTVETVRKRFWLVLNMAT